MDNTRIFFVLIDNYAAIVPSSLPSPLVVGHVQASNYVAVLRALDIYLRNLFIQSNVFKLYILFTITP
jgi:hypothetical protein